MFGRHSHSVAPTFSSPGYQLPKSPPIIMVSPGPIPSLLINLAYPPRRLLLHASLFTHHTPPPPLPPPPYSGPTPAAVGRGEPSFDANVIMILAVLLCALICAIGLNFVVRCALRCSAAISAAPSPAPPRCGGSDGGVKKAALKSIPTVAYSTQAGGGLPCGSWSECAICLSDFAEGERVRVLPGCNHGFHVRCIDKWLNANATCPTCRSSCLCTMQKKPVRNNCVGHQSPATPARPSSAPTLPPPPPPPPPPPQPQQPPRASAIRPLDHEGVLVEGMLVGRY